MRQATEVYSKEFDRVFLALSLALRQRIEVRIRDLGSRLETYPHLRLQGREEFKLHVGDYRIIYEFDTSKNEIYLLAMGHRREVYR
jgi:mRNA-degrading endonuclease RelE of RelBE toxin-antitoxin system